MNIECVVQNCKILNIEDKSSQDGKINWTEVVFLQGTNCNTVTIDKKVKNNIIIGEEYDLLLIVTENVRASNNVAYKVNKFKCLDASVVPEN